MNRPAKRCACRAVGLAKAGLFTEPKTSASQNERVNHAHIRRHTRPRLYYSVAKNVPRNHHYICEFLLKNFADDDGTLWIYDSELRKCRDGNTRSAGFERDLYALTLVGKGRDFAALEKALEQQIDSPGAVAIRRLLNHEQCSGPEWMNFLGFVAAQLLRTPAFFDRLTAVQAPVMQEMLERMANFDPKFREGVRKSMMKRGATSAEVERQLQAAGSGRYKARPNRDWIVANAVRLIPVIHSELEAMHWTFLDVPDGGPDLLISDCPVMLTDPSADDRNPKPLGLKNPNIELAMPLSRRMVAVARREGPNSFGKLVDGSAEIVNLRTLSYARRFVFASYRSNQLLATATRLCGSGPKVHFRKIRMGKGLAMISEYR